MWFFFSDLHSKNQRLQTRNHAYRVVPISDKYFPPPNQILPIQNVSEEGARKPEIQVNLNL